MSNVTKAGIQSVIVEILTKPCVNILTKITVIIIVPV